MKLEGRLCMTALDWIDLFAARPVPSPLPGLEGTEMNLILRPVRSSVGSKYVMALTGLALIGFVLAHMAGNLLIYAGPNALNSYAHALKENPGLLWTARTGLLIVFLLHVIIGIRLSLQNSSARPIRYSYEQTMQANWASRHMLLTGMVLLAFVLYHLAQFTFGVVTTAQVQAKPDGGLQPVQKDYLDLAEIRRSPGLPYRPDPTLNLRTWSEQKHSPGEEARQDVYSMVVSAFRNPWVTISYLVAMAFLGLHLWHGGSSWFQSLGLNHPRFNPVYRAFGPVLALIVVAGNCSIPLSVFLGVVK
jgi:succinate dehydrogenase / fumarate reductase cytochrome b subunit